MRWSIMARKGSWTRRGIWLRRRRMASRLMLRTAWFRLPLGLPWDCSSRLWWFILLGRSGVGCSLFNLAFSLDIYAIRMPLHVTHVYLALSWYILHLISHCITTYLLTFTSLITGNSFLFCFVLFCLLFLFLGSIKLDWWSSFCIYCTIHACTQCSPWAIFWSPCWFRFSFFWALPFFLSYHILLLHYFIFSFVFCFFFLHWPLAFGGLLSHSILRICLSVSVYHYHLCFVASIWFICFLSSEQASESFSFFIFYFPSQFLNSKKAKQSKRRFSLVCLVGFGVRCTDWYWVGFTNINLFIYLSWSYLFVLN